MISEEEKQRENSHEKGMRWIGEPWVVSECRALVRQVIIYLLPKIAVQKK
jgi:hypothetical protein